MSTALLNPAHVGPSLTGIAARSSTPRLRITRRGRVALAVIVALPLAATAWSVFDADDGAIATGTAATTVFDYVQVEAGQSLWQIASAVAPSEDPRDVVSEMVRLNGLASSDVFPGQRLAVPQQYEN